MNTELIGKMIDAGFTKNEIMQMVNGNNIEPANTEPAPVENSPVVNQDPSPVETAPIETPNEPETPTETNTSEQMEKRLSGIEKNIADLVKAMQLNNVRNDSFNNNLETLEERTDKAMAEIIRPARRTKGA